VVRVLASHQCGLGLVPALGPFLEGHKKFLHPKSRSKISRVLTAELFYSCTFNMNRDSLDTRSVRRMHLSVFKYRLTKNGFSGPKRFRGFQETGPWCHMRIELVGSCLASRVFLWVLWFSSVHQNQHLQIPV